MNKEQILEELRQCEGAREFVPGEKNWRILFSHCDEYLLSEYTYDMEILGVDIFFPTDDLALKAIETVGRDRIEKHVFGIKSPLDKLVDKASEIVGEPLYLHECGRDDFALKSKGTRFTYFVFHADLTFSFNTRWSMFLGLSSSKRKQLIEAVTEYYEEVENDL